MNLVLNSLFCPAMIRQLYRFLHPRFQNLFLEYRVHLRPRYGHGSSPHPQLFKIIDANRDSYCTILREALKHTESLHQIRDLKFTTDATLPAWNNDYLPGLDIIGIYTMISYLRPSRFVEVGSGNSTKIAFKAKRELGLSMEITSIDPEPRVEIDHLSDVVIRERFEDIDHDTVLALAENDVLFIDNSHRILPNSDSMVFFLEILPKLRPGVVVHLHDIYLPYDYPQFMCDRFYSEQYGLAIHLLANPDRAIVLLPNYFVSEDKELSGIIAPIWDHDNLIGVERHGGSFWIQVNEP